MGGQAKLINIIQKISEDFIQISSEPHDRNDYTISSQIFTPFIGSCQRCTVRAQITSSLELIPQQNSNMHHQVNYSPAFKSQELKQGIGAQLVGDFIIQTGSRSELQHPEILMQMEKGSKSQNLSNHRRQLYKIFVQSREWIDQKKPRNNLAEHECSFIQTPPSQLQAKFQLCSSFSSSCSDSFWRQPTEEAGVSLRNEDYSQKNLKY